MRSTYTTEGKTVIIKDNDEDSTDTAFDVDFVADGKSWSSYVEILDSTMEFKADPDTSWVK